MSISITMYNTYMQRRRGKGKGKGGGGALGWRKKFTFWEMERYNDLTLADKFKPIRATVLLEEEFFAVGELPCLTSFAFRRIRAIEVGNMLVAYVAEPKCTQFSIVGGERKIVTRGKK